MTSLQHARPRLKSGQVFGSLVSTDKETSLLYELADGSRQVSLPAHAAHVLPLLDGTRTIPDILETLYRTIGRIPFKTFFSTLQKLQTQGCLDGAEALVTPSARTRTEMFEREPLWLTRAIFSFPIAPGKILGEPSVLAFVLFAIGMLVVTLSFMIGAIGLGFVHTPSGFLRIQESYIKGILFFFVSASVLMTAKTVIKAILSLLLTGARSKFDLELGLFSLAVRSRDDKIYMAGGRVLGTLAFAAVASSYFFIFAVASAVAPHWSLLDDLLWVSAILALVDLNPFRRSDLSSFFNIVYNRRSRPELLPYLKNRGLLAFRGLGDGPQFREAPIYTAYTVLAIAWTMIAYNLLLSLFNRNDTTLISTILTTMREGPRAELLAASLILGAIGLSLLYLVGDLVWTVVRNLLFPLRTQALANKSEKRIHDVTLENVERLAHELGQIPLFAGLHTDAVLFLISKGQARAIPKGTHAIVQDTPSQELYILLSGEMSVQKRRATGAVEELTQLKAPTVFGENTVLNHAPRSADVVALADSRVIAIPRRAIEDLANHTVLRTEAEALLDRLILGQYVAASDFLSEAPREVASLFFNEGQIVQVATGRHIVEQGRTDKDFYLLIRGSVDVIHDGKVIARLQQGDFFGEMALIMNAPRSATIITREPCRLLKLSSQQFWKVLSEHASIALYLEAVSETRVTTSEVPA